MRRHLGAESAQVGARVARGDPRGILPIAPREHNPNVRRGGYVILFHPHTGPRFLGTALHQIAWAAQQDRDGVIGFALLATALNFAGQAILADRHRPVATGPLN